jgi:hypothetical protein
MLRCVVVGCDVRVCVCVCVSVVGVCSEPVIADSDRKPGAHAGLGWV